MTATRTAPAALTPTSASAPPSPMPASAPFTGEVRDALEAAGIRTRTRLRSGFSLSTLNAFAPVRVIVTWHPAPLAPRRVDREEEGLRRCQTVLSAAQFSAYSLSAADGPHLAVWPKAGTAAGPVRG